MIGSNGSRPEGLGDVGRAHGESLAEGGGGRRRGRGAPQHVYDADIIVIGSGFGGSVAALRFAEAGHSVIVLERGDHVRRETFEPDADMFWSPRRHRFGMNELRRRGRHVIPWLGSAVGGGSHVYAATLFRRHDFDGFPEPIRSEGLDRHYDRATEMMDAVPYPDYPPYSDVPSLELLVEAEVEVARERPGLVEDCGMIPLGISFAPPGAEPGATFVNRHGCRQRYADPSEQKLLGGDIGSKNSVDRNYLHRAQELGATIHALTRADKLDRLEVGGWRVHTEVFRKESSRFRRFVRHWLPTGAEPAQPGPTFSARRLVLSAGSIGSTELLLRNRDVHRTLDSLSPALGARYSSNGDYVNLLMPFKGILVGWAAVAAAVAGAVAGWGWLVGVSLVVYFAVLVIGRPAFDPDLGTTNSDFIRFRHRDGSPQGSYIEGGRYPTPLRAAMSALLSTFGLWRVHRYAGIVRVTRTLRKLLPPFELIARSWPVPLLQMGRDDAVGTMRLDEDGRLIIDYPFEENGEFYAYLDDLARMIARAADSWFVPNMVARRLQVIEVPHNLGGVPMGATAEEGVVDHAGRVFGYDDLMVLDGSIIPTTLGPNPALTILALAERAMDVVLGDEAEDHS